MRPNARLATCALLLAVSLTSPIAGNAPPPGPSFRLGPMTMYPAAHTTNGGIALGDLNGDGYPDVVVVNTSSPATIEIRLNDGHGAFGPSTPYPVASNPSAVALADLNTDGALDVVVAPHGGVGVGFRLIQPGIAVLLGNGDGTVQAQIFSPLAAPVTGQSTGPETIALGDMNGDGLIDAVAQRWGEIDVALGDGAGGFSVASRTTGEARELRLGDFDRDGLLDVAAIADEATKLYRGVGTGGLFPPTVAYAREATAMDSGDVGDVNGDGLLDIVLIENPSLGSDPKRIVAIPGTGDGTFAAPQVTVLSGNETDSAVLADMDRDGILDLVHQGIPFTPFGIMVSLGHGDGTFSAPYFRETDVYTDRIAVADLDGNGLLDVAITAPLTGFAVFMDGADHVAPVLSLPADITAPATSPSGATVTYTASATDDVDGTVAVSCSPASGSLFPEGDTTVTCSAADAAGNHAEGTFHIVVRDGVAPVVTVPADFTTSATSASGATVTFAASATDDVDGAIAASCMPVSGSVFPIGDTTVTCSATDAAGNRADDTFHVVVNDAAAPVLHLPADITAPATSASGATVTYSVGATDNVDSVVAIGCTPDSGIAFPIGDTTVTCVAVDAAGNRAEGTFHVVVRDVAAPVLTLPADISASATNASGAAVAYTASAIDNVDGTVAVSCTPASNAAFPLGETTVACSATDAAGNRTDGTFRVVVRDTVAPALTLPADITAASTSASGATVTYSASATDDVNGTVTVACTPAAGSVFPIGDTTVTCHATDAAGNRADGTFHVVVRDGVPPVLILPADITAQATDASGASVSYSVGATDNVGGTVAIACTPDSGIVFPIGNTTVMCAAIDVAGNRAEQQFVVRVLDTIAPQLSVPGDISVVATAAGASVTYTATAVDLVDGAVSPACAPASGAVFPVGNTTVTCTATDARGNSSTPKSFTVSVSVALPNLDDLFARLIAESTGVGPGKSLESKARKARKEYREGDTCEVCEILESYLKELRAQTGKKVTPAKAASLTDLVHQIQAMVGCGTNHRDDDDRDGDHDRDDHDRRERRNGDDHGRRDR